MRKIIKKLKSKFWALTIVAPLMVLPLIGCSRALTKMEETALKEWSTKEGNEKLYSWYLQKIYTKLKKDNNSVEPGNFIKNILYSETQNEKNNKLKEFFKFILAQELRDNVNYITDLFAKLDKTNSGLNYSIIKILKEKITKELSENKEDDFDDDFWKTHNRYPRNKLNKVLEKLNEQLDRQDKNKIETITEIPDTKDSNNAWYDNTDSSSLIKNHKTTTYIDLFLWLIMSNPGNGLDIKIWHMAIVDHFLANVKQPEFKKYWTNDNKNKSYETYVEDLDEEEHWLLNRRLLVEKLMLHWKLDLEKVKDKPEADEEEQIKDLLEEYDEEKEQFYRTTSGDFSIKEFVEKQFILNLEKNKEPKDLISLINHKYNKYKYSHINKNDFWTYQDFGLNILDKIELEDEVEKTLKKHKMYGFAGIGEIPKSNNQWFDYSTKDITKMVEYENLVLAGLLHKPHDQDNYNLITKNGNEWPTIKQKGGNDNKDITGAVQYMVGLMPRYKSVDGKRKLTLKGTFLEGKEKELRMILGTRGKVIKEALNYYEYEKGGEIKLKIPNILREVDFAISLWTKENKNWYTLEGGNERLYQQGFLSHDWSYITNKEIENLIKISKK